MRALVWHYCNELPLNMSGPFLTVCGRRDVDQARIVFADRALWEAARGVMLMPRCATCVARVAVKRR